MKQFEITYFISLHNIINHIHVLPYSHTPYTYVYQGSKIDDMPHEIKKFMIASPLLSLFPNKICS